ncbi:MAG: Unknown protein [uncultured Sulfurovum sp.]|uniref:Rhodanese domain-containing protein n=1 Tax=uncultured Sulfurovum sp. TaxID=269237 RepID=A0A6S6RYK3_9BACT|nr:MAG: Unknown protein [uncultured Sulfurovum sp.]
MRYIYFFTKQIVVIFVFTMGLGAIEVNIKEGVPYVDVDINGANIKIERIQDVNHKLKNSYTKTSRAAPPFSIQPYQPVDGIETISELDVIEFIKNDISENDGLMIDARMQRWHVEGTIPGAMNIPFTMFSSDSTNSKIEEIFKLFGGTKEDIHWNFNKSKRLIIFDNGPWCQQGVRAMKHLVSLGFPKSKIRYYRGGMQYWQILGLTTHIPES